MGLAADDTYMARPKAARGARAEEREVAARSDLGGKHWSLAAAVSALDDHVYFVRCIRVALRVCCSPARSGVSPRRPAADDEDVVAIWQSRIEPDRPPGLQGCELELLAGRPAMVDYRVHGLDGKTRWYARGSTPSNWPTARCASPASSPTSPSSTRPTTAGPHSPELAAANEPLDAAHSQALELARTDALTGPPTFGM